MSNKNKIIAKRKATRIAARIAARKRNRNKLDIDMYKSKFNKSLEQFNNIHKEKTGILFATGPTIKQYKHIENSENFITFGVNTIYNYPDITNDLNYYFYGSWYYVAHDHRKNIEKFLVEKKNIISFASAYEEGRSHKDINRGNITPERAIALGSIPFENNLSTFTNDVSKYATFGKSIVFPALQIMLYMGINKIYIVGCDGGYTDNNLSKVHSGDKRLLECWQKFIQFKKKYYPSVKIISVNPVSLEKYFDYT
jgi:hypothetical protein